MAKKPLPISPLAPERFPDVPSVAGVRLSPFAAGLRYQGRPDLLLVELAPGTAVAGMLTTSLTCGHPVHWCRAQLPGGRARALIVNAGNANVFRGADGDRAVRREAEAVAALLDCPPEQVFVASTGVIGARFDPEPIVARLPEMKAALRGDAFPDAARAIMTTDTFPKAAVGEATVDGRKVTIAGIAKGSGMVAPNTATVFGFVFTDAAVAPEVLRPLWRRAVDRSFNAITVDGDTSTSDTFLLFATGRAGHAPIERADDPRLPALAHAIEAVAADLAVQIVRDGEGAQKLITIRVTGAVDDGSARRIGLSIANSPLIKTAIAGEDANWGRIVMGVGKAGEPVEVERLGVAFGGFPVARDGAAVPDLDEVPVTQHLKGREIEIDVAVGGGPGRATVWTCDLTHGYIDINADYRS
ncbi:MAG: bifunctional glutamate N-acetyltransferase/amino-acid acetyltransferase ArgJ [Geminicoccaceae bacterium]